MVERVTGARAADERLRLIEEQLRTGLWWWDRASNEVNWSPGLYRLLGLDPTAVQPSLPLFETLVHPRDRLALAEPSTLATNPRQRMRHFRVIRPDGRLRLLRSSAHTTFDRDGDVLRVMAVVNDVTEQQEARERYAADRAMIQTVADLLQMSVWRADKNGLLLDIVSPASSDGQSETTVETWRDLLHPDDRERIGELWRDAVLRRVRYEYTPRVRNPDGTYRTIRAVGLPLARVGSEDEQQMAGIVLADSRFLPTAPDSTATETSPMSPAQVRAGRAYLNWSAEDLAGRAGISVSTVRRIESETGARPNAESLKQIRLAFERAGLVLWHNASGQPCLAGPAG